MSICGKCFHGKPVRTENGAFDLSVVDCKRVPPAQLVMPNGSGVAIILRYPRLGRNEPMCDCFQERPVVQSGSAVDPGGIAPIQA